VRTSARERKRDKRTRDKRTREQEIRDVTTHSLRLLASSVRTSARERKRDKRTRDKRRDHSLASLARFKLEDVCKRKEERQENKRQET
jgi:hypothetical protein